MCKGTWGTIVAFNRVAMLPSIIDSVGVFGIEVLDLEVQSALSMTLRKLNNLDSCWGRSSWGVGQLLNLLGFCLVGIGDQIPEGLGQ